MKPEEAIKTLKHYRSNLIDMCGENSTESEPIQAYDAAITAIEKQIPKKPHITLMRNDAGELFGQWVMCPRCYEESGFDYDFLVGMKQKQHHKVSYCLGCGQAIDWSENHAY